MFLLDIARQTALEGPEYCPENYIKFPSFKLFHLFHQHPQWLWIKFRTDRT
jgi:hypothetical protein